jgi:hypothetical protein
MRDMIDKGRAKFVGFKSPNYRRPAGKKGSENGRAKLTEEDVREMKTMFGFNRLVDIASWYGVSFATVQRISAGTSWKHVTHDAT